MNRTRTLLGKELLELGRSRGLLLSMFALPTPMVVVAVMLVLTSLRMPINDLHQLMEFYKITASGNDRVAMIAAWTRACLGLFMIMPLFVPVMISAQTVAGEKERRTIEPLLASPLTAREIVVAKSLAAVVPAMVVTLVAFAVFAVAVDILTWPLAGRILVPDLAWIYAVFVLAPLLSFLGNTVTVVVSARVNDSRLAQQLSALIVIPLLGLVTVQFLGFFALGPILCLILAVALAVADALLLAIAVRLFDRQRILSRWG